MVDPDKIKSLKEKSKRTLQARNIRIVILVVIVIIVVFFGFLTITTIMSQQKTTNVVAPNLDKIKEDAKKAVNEMFKAYPNDPMKNVFLGKIDAATSIEEINNIINEAKEYISKKKNLDNVKENVINLIESEYGDLLQYSQKAKDAILKIKLAKTPEEVEKIYNSLDIVGDKKEIVLNLILKELSLGDNYYYVKYKEDNETKSNFYSRAKLLSLKDTLNYQALKSIKIEPVSNFKKVALEVSAKRCGELPLENSIVAIYNKNGSLLTYAIVDSSYLLLDSVSYGESKDVSNSINSPVDQYSSSQSSSISYNLNNIPGILEATVIGKLDYDKIKQMFENFGIRLNKLSKETQIFDSKMNYFLILSVPDDGVEKLIKTNKNEITIVLINSGE
ncbi:Protein of unknown function DUF515 [Methanocaldococcus infernus ME]|uniref:Protein G-related albumin-binding (GA) module domain-containing protein n=1 Tax=Methanocaldococcus infernus (strain DSM 11812 / JCM 15783 / ME) TaxID=573063 RepID=D5VR10_METIM|nr:DUF515 domain-containing protein [Methanocaldococcus infernus]ADG13013.1 Protein of unknown function DUF515 [Methanocaldococcus infernus ME]